MPLLPYSYSKTMPPLNARKRAYLKKHRNETNQFAPHLRDQLENNKSTIFQGNKYNFGGKKSMDWT